MNDKENPVTFDPSHPANPEPAAAPSEAATFAPQPVVPGGTRVQVRRRSSSAMWLNVLLALAAIVAVGGIAFAVGRTTAPVAAAAQRGNGAFGNGAFPRGSFDPNASGAPGAGFQGGFRGGGFNLSGTVQSITSQTLTITTANGQTLEFTLGADTTYSTKVPATAADVKTGSKVEVQLQPGTGGRPTGSPAPSAGPLGTANSVTVVP
jgi:hypothetical protein